MNPHISRALWFCLLCAAGCAKKEPKPLRTEPWLAHPVASTQANTDAALPAIRYAITEPSQVRFELPTKRGPLRGSLARVSGELSFDLADLGRSRAQVRADLGSLSFQTAARGDDPALLERARSALELSDAGPAASASFELTAVEDLTPTQLEAAPESDAGAPFTRKVRATAVGDLLLHGFRVVRRAPLEAEFGYSGDRQAPNTVLIRSRAPFVVSLETHAIRALSAESSAKAPAGPSAQAREVRVSIELYGRKID